MYRSSWHERIAEAASSKKERTKLLLAQMKERQARANRSEPPPAEGGPAAVTAAAASPDPVTQADSDLGVMTTKANQDLAHFIDLLDEIIVSEDKLHIALFWPHIPPRAILPWMLREVIRGRISQPVRTLFLNMERAALQAVAGMEAQTLKLRARGIVRSGADDGNVPGVIGADAHFYMLLGDTRDSGIASVPVISIVPHSVALNDGTFWRDFDEKTLKGFKCLYPTARLKSIRKHLDVLSSAEQSPAFAFLLPPHFPESDRRHALRSIPGTIELAIVDMTTHALRGRNASELIRTLISELVENLRRPPQHALVLTDCPLRFSFIRRSLRTWRDSGIFDSKPEGHRLIWATRGRGFEESQIRSNPSRPIVETIASSECIVATRLWKHASKLDEGDPLASVLYEGAAALKGMGLTASGADAILAPYTDVHDAYHRVKRERHSFEPHYNKAMALVGEGHAGAWRDAIQSDLAEALALAATLRTETPLMRYLKRTLPEIDPCNDVVVVLRHPEDAQQANYQLLDFLTEPGSFPAGVPELRVTTPSHYSSEVERTRPTVVIWAASANLGARAYIGDAYCPPQFRLVVAGQDASALNRILSLSLLGQEYTPYRERVDLLLKALPWVPKEFGGLSAALSLDSDKPRRALPFTGQGYLLLDGYGKISAGPGSQFYVLDPVSHQLAPRDARSIDLGDAVFVMSDAIREEIEAALREKDDKGRTLEQALVDQYKATVKKGIEALSQKYGNRGLSTRVHDMLFEQNPELPSISKQAVDYWLLAAERSEVDTPHAAINPLHIEAFLRLMGTGVLARPLTDAVRIVRSDLRRDGHTNRGLFDRLLLDADSLIQGPQSSFARLKGIRRDAMESVYPVLEKHMENPQLSAADVNVLEMAAQ
jgi:hypothetical protein